MGEPGVCVCEDWFACGSVCSCVTVHRCVCASGLMDFDSFSKTPPALATVTLGGQATWLPLAGCCPHAHAPAPPTAPEPDSQHSTSTPWPLPECPLASSGPFPRLRVSVNIFKFTFDGTLVSLFWPNSQQLLDSDFPKG